MRKIGIGREVRNESITCRPCSINFVDKSLREVIDFCTSHLLCFNFFAFYHEICIYVFEILIEKTHQNLVFKKCYTYDRCYH